MSVSGISPVEVLQLLERNAFNVVNKRTGFARLVEVSAQKNKLGNGLDLEIKANPNVPAGLNSTAASSINPSKLEPELEELVARVDITLKSGKILHSKSFKTSMANQASPIINRALREEHFKTIDPNNIEDMTVEVRGLDRLDLILPEASVYAALPKVLATNAGKSTTQSSDLESLKKQSSKAASDSGTSSVSETSNKVLGPVDLGNATERAISIEPPALDGRTYNSESFGSESSGISMTDETDIHPIRNATESERLGWMAVNPWHKECLEDAKQQISNDTMVKRRVILAAGVLLGATIGIIGVALVINPITGPIGGSLAIAGALYALRSKFREDTNKNRVKFEFDQKNNPVGMKIEALEKQYEKLIKKGLTVEEYQELRLRNPSQWLEQNIKIEPKVKPVISELFKSSKQTTPAGISQPMAALALHQGVFSAFRSGMPVDSNQKYKMRVDKKGTIRVLDRMAQEVKSLSSAICVEGQAPQFKRRSRLNPSDFFNWGGYTLDTAEHKKLESVEAFLNGLVETVQAGKEAIDSYISTIKHHVAINIESEAVLSLVAGAKLRAQAYNEFKAWYNACITKNSKIKLARVMAVYQDQLGWKGLMKHVGVPEVAQLV